MKYIIELPEEVKRKFDKTDNINFCFYDYNSFIGKAIRNGIPLSEELEAIKAEFEEIKGLRDNPYNNETEYSVSVTELRELLDKHIAELKGIVDRIEEPVKKALSELKGEQK